MNMERAWWMSWYSLRDRATFELHSPWWVSGYDADGNDIMVAAVRSPSEAAAYELIRSSYDGYDGSEDPITERFAEDVDEPGWSPFSGRWPQAKWMAWTSDGRTCNCPRHAAGVLP